MSNWKDKIRTATIYLLGCSMVATLWITAVVNADYEQPMRIPPFAVSVNSGESSNSSDDSLNGHAMNIEGLDVTTVDRSLRAA